MNSHLFKLKCGGVTLALVGYGCLSGILPAAELKPLLEDNSSTPLLSKSGSATVDTNRMSLPSATKKVSVPSKPNELNLRLLLNRAPLPAPPQMPTTLDGKDRDLLDDEKAWSFITPQDVLDDYMARHILKMPEYGPDGRRNDPRRALERFYERLARGDGTTNGFSSLVLFGLQPRPDKTIGKGNGKGNGKSKDENSDDDSAEQSDRRDVFGNVPDADPDNRFFGWKIGSSDSDSQANGNSKATGRDVSLESARVMRAQKEHLDTVRKVWNFESPAATGQPDPADTLPWLKGMPTLPDATPGVTRPDPINLSPSALLPTTFNPSSARPELPTGFGAPGAATPSVGAPPSAPSVTPSFTPPPRTPRAPMSQPFTIPQRRF